MSLCGLHVCAHIQFIYLGLLLGLVQLHMHINVMYCVCLLMDMSFDLSSDHTLVRTFLMTYRSFCSPTKLLDLLIERYRT